MWIIPSRRSHLIERVFSKAAPTSKGIVVINAEMASAYESVKIPENWKFHVVTDCRFYRDKVNQTFKDFPDEPYYGIIGDDTVPETLGWDIFLGEKAGTKNIAIFSQANDDRVGGGGALGGDLVRACGWLCCPVVKHFYSDDVVELIGAEFKCLTKYEGIRIAHHHFAVGMAPYDDVYKMRSDGGDKQAFEAWKRDEWPVLKEKLAPLYERSSASRDSQVEKAVG